VAYPGPSITKKIDFAASLVPSKALRGGVAVFDNFCPDLGQQVLPTEFPTDTEKKIFFPKK
jgi:hypothetical protein